jgi:hypothetical protein
MSNFHDAYRSSTVTNLTFATSAGTAVSTAGFGTQTRYIQVVSPGVATATGGARFLVGKSAIATTITGNYLPFNWIQICKVTPGEQLSCVSNDGTGGAIIVVELVD